MTTEVFTRCPVWAPGASLDINHPITPPVSHIRLRSTLNNQLVIYSRPLSASQKASLSGNFLITPPLMSPPIAWRRPGSGDCPRCIMRGVQHGEIFFFLQSIFFQTSVNNLQADRHTHRRTGTQPIIVKDVHCTLYITEIQWISPYCCDRQPRLGQLGTNSLASLAPGVAMIAASPASAEAGAEQKQAQSSLGHFEAEINYEFTPGPVSPAIRTIVAASRDFLEG